MLREQGVPTDGASLLEFLRTRAGGTATSEKLAGLIKQLGADLSADRERACAGLLALGPLAIPSLRQAVKDPDVPRAAALAERCLRTLEHNSASTSAAALRVLAARKPRGRRRGDSPIPAVGRGRDSARGSPRMPWRWWRFTKARSIRPWNMP